MSEPTKEASVNSEIYDANGKRSVHLGENFGFQLLDPIRKLEGTPQGPRFFSFHTTYHGSLSWLSLYFSQEPTAHEGQVLDSDYRGYLMVEPEDMVRALGVLLRVASRRMQMGKRTDFKLLTKKNGPPADKFEDFGKYENLEITDPRIVLYGNTSLEVRDVMEDIVREGWDELEASRLQKAGDVKRDSACEYFTDQNSRVWRTLNWNNFAGSTEMHTSL